MDGSIFLLVVLAFLIAMMVLSGRRQKKAVARQQELIDSLVPGDRVMTSAGLHATVSAVDVDGTTIDLELAPGVVTTWEKVVVRTKLDPEDAADGTTPDGTTKDGADTEDAAGDAVDDA